MATTHTPAGGAARPAAKRTTAKKAPTKRAPAKKATAKKAPTKKAPATRVTATPSARPTDAPRTAAPAARPLREREARDLLITAGLALTGVVAGTVYAVNRLPDTVERLRAQSTPRAERVPAELRAGIHRAERVVGRELDTLAVRGRSVLDTIATRPDVVTTRRRAIEAIDALRRVADSVGRPTKGS
jgi:hypothetical protein